MRKKTLTPGAPSLNGSTVASHDTKPTLQNSRNLRSRLSNLFPQKTRVGGRQATTVGNERKRVRTFLHVATPATSETDTKQAAKPDPASSNAILVVRHISLQTLKKNSGLLTAHNLACLTTIRPSRAQWGLRFG